MQFQDKKSTTSHHQPDAHILNQLYLSNIQRGKLFSVFIMVILFPLLFLDYLRFQPLTGEMYQGGQLVFIGHLFSFLLIVLCFLLALRYNSLERTGVTQRYRVAVNTLLYLLLMSTTLVSAGDIMMGTGIANYLSAIMLFSILVYFPRWFSVFFFFSMTLALSVFIHYVGTDRDQMLTNLYVYTFIAFAASRYMYYMKKNDIRLQAELDNSRKLYKAIFDSSPDPIVIHDGERILNANQATARALGVPSTTEIIGRDPFLFVHPEDITKSSSRVMEMIRTHKALPPEEFKFLVQGNEERTVIATPMPIIYQEKPAMMVNYHDITDQKRAENVARISEDRAHLQRTAIARLAVDENLDEGPLESSFQKLTETVASVLSVNRCSIWLFDEDRFLLVCRDLYDNIQQQHKLDSPLTVSDYPRYFNTLYKENLLATTDVANDPRLIDFKKPGDENQPARSIMDCAINMDGRLIGVLCMETSGDDHAWLPSEEAFASNIASLAAHILLNKKRRAAEKALEDSYKVSEIINDILRKVNSTGSMDELFLTVHQSVSRLFNAQNFYIALLNKEKTRIHFPYYRDEMDKWLEEGSESNDIDAGDSRSLTAQVVREGQGMLLDDKAINEKFADSNDQFYGSLPLQWLGVPIRIREDIIGGIVVQSYNNPNQYTPADKTFLETVAESIAPAFERIIAETALRESRKKYQDLFEKSADANLIIENSVFIDFNQAAQDMLQLSAADRHKKIHPADISPAAQPDGENSLEKSERMMQLAIDNGSNRFEWIHVRGNGEAFPTEILLTAIYPEDGKPLIHTVVRDITEKKKTEEAMLKSQRLGAIGEMASAVAHDFNNSLQSIFGNLELATMFQKLPEELRQYLHSMKTAAEDAATRVQLLQRFGGKKQSRSVYGLVDMNQVVQDVILQSRPLWKDQAEKNGIVITIETTPGSIPPVTGNEGELRSVLYNIVKNSTEAMPEGGSIRISTDMDGGMVQTRVCDNGSGMSDEVASRIFQPLFSTKGFEAGRGFGMSGAYSIIQEHKGQITVKQSKPGKGTCIEILLPKSAAEKKSLPEEKAEDTEARRLRILWVEDDASIRNLATKYLQILKQDGDFAATGQEALEYLAGNSYDLVISDIGMPEMNGWQLAEIIREKFDGKLRITLISGWAAQIDDDEKDKYNIYSILGKPIRLEQLRELIRQVTSES